ncbi:unnamed protein product [Mesocestoides corti]|uniref:Dentin sialophosphoprotein-like n=1 Tax=Mesocestoides corti TaxID=53468 RepID=A0A0R3U7S0_MESCO|nr:unnamed protein product [Mesocestoides corti]
MQVPVQLLLVALAAMLIILQGKPLGTIDGKAQEHHSTERGDEYLHNEQNMNSTESHHEADLEQMSVTDHGHWRSFNNTHDEKRHLPGNHTELHGYPNHLVPHNSSEPPELTERNASIIHKDHKNKNGTYDKPLEVTDGPVGEKKNNTDEEHDGYYFESVEVEINEDKNNSNGTQPDHCDGAEVVGNNENATVNKSSNGCQGHKDDVSGSVQRETLVSNHTDKCKYKGGCKNRVAGKDQEDNFDETLDNADDDKIDDDGDDDDDDERKDDDDDDDDDDDNEDVTEADDDEENPDVNNSGEKADEDEDQHSCESKEDEEDEEGEDDSKHKRANCRNKAKRHLDAMKDDDDDDDDDDVVGSGEGADFE